MNIFQHTQVPVPDDCKFAISPSSIGKFFDSPVTWYKEYILGESQFNGNTSTVKGTCAHYMAECTALNKPIDHSLIEQNLAELNNDDVDKQEVLSTYRELGNLFIDYVKKNRIDEVERQLCTEIKNGIYIKGTNDARQGSTIVDYKTASKKPSDTIPFNYYIQLMAYAYMYKAQGVFIDRIRLVYAVAPTKTLPARQFIVSQMITDADWKMIEDTLTLMADTIQLHFDKPELDYITFKSMQFYVPPKPKLFLKANHDYV